MKGFCTPNGTPRGLPWLTGLETHVIIERFNAILRGVVNDKAGLVPFYSLSRWIYILTFSCIYTIARKFNLSLPKVFKRFGVRHKNTHTIRSTVVIKHNEDLYYREWRLLTYMELKELCNTPKEITRMKLLQQSFWDTEKGLLGKQYTNAFSDKPKFPLPVVRDKDYLRKISFVNARTQASFNLPCSLCGSFKLIEMHHIKHVRKGAYHLIPQVKTWAQVMALRNRKQIPVCRYCHTHRIHAGKYNGKALISLNPVRKLFDNRIVHIESFVKLGKEYFSQSLFEKGWKKCTHQWLNTHKKN